MAPSFPEPVFHVVKALLCEYSEYASYPVDVVTTFRVKQAMLVLQDVQVYQDAMGQR